MENEFNKQLKLCLKTVLPNDYYVKVNSIDT